MIGGNTIGIAVTMNVPHARPPRPSHSALDMRAKITSTHAPASAATPIGRRRRTRNGASITNAAPAHPIRTVPRAGGITAGATRSSIVTRASPCSSSRSLAANAARDPPIAIAPMRGGGAPGHSAAMW